MLKSRVTVSISGKEASTFRFQFNITAFIEGKKESSVQSIGHTYAVNPGVESFASIRR